MTTGKIEYSPDYKSETKPYPHIDGAFKRLERRADLLRLRQLVVGKARDWSKVEDKDAHAKLEAERSLREAVIALEKFENEHVANNPTL